MRIKKKIMCIFDYPKKVKLLCSIGWYRTLSGAWRDGHMLRYISRKDFRNMTLKELQEMLNYGKI